MNFDVIIIGAGPGGIFAAYELMQKNGVCSFEMDCGHKMELLHEYKEVTMRYKSLMGKAEIEFLTGKYNPETYEPVPGPKAVATIITEGPDVAMNKFN